MKQASHTSLENRSEETRLLAHHLWEQAGCPLGQDTSFWLKAEQQLLGGGHESPKSSAKRLTKPAGNGTAKSRAQPASKRLAMR